MKHLVELFRLHAQHGWALLLLGAVGFGLYQVLWTTGLKQVTAGNSALLIASSPVLPALLAVVLLTTARLSLGW